MLQRLRRRRGRAGCTARQTREREQITLMQITHLSAKIILAARNSVLGCHGDNESFQIQITTLQHGKYHRKSQSPRTVTASPLLRRPVWQVRQRCVDALAHPLLRRQVARLPVAALDLLHLELGCHHGVCRPAISLGMCRSVAETYQHSTLPASPSGTRQ